VNDLRATVAELTELIPGKLLPLRRNASLPASLLVGGVEMFGALPARAGDTRAAQVLALEKETASAGPEGKEAGKK
jgi:flagellar motor switch protein FliM